MRILAIDPGYDRCGIAVVEGDRSKPSLVYSTCVQTSSKDDFHTRLSMIGGVVRHVINQYAPDIAAIEKLYFNTNQKTAMQVAEVRGMLLYLTLSSGLAVKEYTPLQVKMAVVGHGRGDKKQIVTMIPRLIRLPNNKSEGVKMLDDEYDAIAIGITALAYTKKIL